MTYAHPECLAETEWLAQHLDDPSIRIIDVTGMLTSSLHNRAGAEFHGVAHIPGATFVDIASAKGAFSDRDAALPWTWPTPAQFERDARAAGINDDSTVVVYAATPRKGVDFGLMWSTRAWWVMHHFGVRCRVLNGGWEKWVAEGRPVSTDAAAPATGRLRTTTEGRRGVATRADVLAAIGPGRPACVVDALSEASFAGTDRMRYGPRKGHISGAVNVPMSRVLDETSGTFLPSSEIRAAFEAAGVSWSRPVITYCGGAIAATLDAFALVLCGHERVAVYDGSLMEWSAVPGLPMTDPSAATPP